MVLIYSPGDRKAENAARSYNERATLNGICTILTLLTSLGTAWATVYFVGPSTKRFFIVLVTSLVVSALMRVGVVLRQNKRIRSLKNEWRLAALNKEQNKGYKQKVAAGVSRHELFTYYSSAMQHK